MSNLCEHRKHRDECLVCPDVVGTPCDDCKADRDALRAKLAELREARAERDNARGVAARLGTETYTIMDKELALRWLDEGYG